MCPEESRGTLGRHTGKVSCPNHFLGATCSIGQQNTLKTVNLVVQKPDTRGYGFLLFLTMLADRVDR